jgi:hypothetical protein
MSMGEEEVNELLKDLESSLAEIMYIRPEHTDSPTADMQSVLTGLDCVSPLNPPLSLLRLSCVDLLSLCCLLLQMVRCSKL